MAAGPSFAPGTLLGQRYRVVREAAQGGMGAVYEACDTRLNDRRCAVKVLLDSGMAPQDQAEAAVWFEREAQILSGLRHPLIPNISDYFSDQGHHYLVMDFVEGETLEQRLTRLGAPGLPIAEVVGWGRQLCEVLHYLHTRRPPVIFRDLKPANVMNEPAGTLKLIDFGIARSLESTRIGQTIYTMIGTPGYSPPEQYQGLADPRSDIYSLGATLHHLISGRDPRQHQPFTFPPLSLAVPEIGPAVEEAITRAVSMQASARFADAQEFAAALAASSAPHLAAHLTRHTPPVPQGPPPDPQHPPAPLPAREVRVTSDQLYWPPVCACCCREADTTYVVDYFRESSAHSSGIGQLSWHIPYCSTCLRHARAHRRAGRHGISIKSAMWLVGALVLAVALMDMSGIGKAMVGIPVAVLIVNAVLVERKLKQDLRALMRDTCGTADYPVAYQDIDPVNEFRFSNGAYAEMFARDNADRLFD